MKPTLEARGTVIDVVITILSPLIVLVMSVVFLLGFWGEAAWRRVKGDKHGW